MDEIGRRSVRSRVDVVGNVVDGTQVGHAERREREREGKKEKMGVREQEREGVEKGK